MGVISERKLQHLARLEQMAQEIETRLMQAKDFRRAVGRIIASSGFKVDPSGCSLDWALIELAPECQGTNLVGLTEIYPCQFRELIGHRCPPARRSHSNHVTSPASRP